MSVLIRGIEMPPQGEFKHIRIYDNGEVTVQVDTGEEVYEAVIAHAVQLPPHGDLIDRDALIKDGWLCLHKEVMRMGGYAIHEMPLKNPSIPVIIEAEREE